MSVLRCGIGFCVAMIMAAQAFAITPVKEIEVSAYSLYFNEPYLYVGGLTSVTIFNVSDPANPTLVSEVETNGPVNGMTSVGNRAFFVLDEANQENMMIVDITNKASPVVLDTRYAGPEGNIPYSIHAVGRDLYIGFSGAGLNTIHVNDDNTLVQLGSLALDDDLFDIVSAGNRLYVSSWWFQLFVVDISDPNNLRLLKTIDTFGFNYRMDIEGDLLACGEGQEGISFYNISNPEDPQLITTVRLGYNEIYAVALREDFCYSAKIYYRSFDVTAPDWPGGLNIIDYEFMNNIRNIDRHDVENARDVVAYNGYVYLAGVVSLNVYKHGPAGTRPTATPILPTPTRTPTPTLTPTNTPKLIPTATPQGSLSTPTPVPPTPTHTHTPTPTATPGMNVPTATPTPGPVNPTSTPVVSSGADYVFEFDQSKLVDNQWSDIFLGGFSGNPSGFVRTIPVSSDYFPQTTDQKGLMFMVSPVGGSDDLNEVCFIHCEQGINTGGNPVLVRAYVKAEDDGGNAEIYIGALKGSFTKGGVDGSIAFISPKNSINYVQSKRIHCYYEPEDSTEMVTPFIQIAAKHGGGDATVYVDRVEVFILKPGVAYDGVMFRSNE
jgi:hypothetical protein